MHGRQLLNALLLLKEIHIVHADIKLDNILVSQDLKTIKLCDFGSAFYEHSIDGRPTPYLVSRFYRAPEVTLGLNYGCSIDLWAVGTCLYELFTGQVLFNGKCNNGMLRVFMETLGKIPNKMLKAHLRAYHALEMEPHFCTELRFKYANNDPVTGQPVVRYIEVPERPHDHMLLSNMIRDSKAGSDNSKLVNDFITLLNGCLLVDPSRRCSVADAACHSFFTA